MSDYDPNHGRTLRVNRPSVTTSVNLNITAPSALDYTFDSIGEDLSSATFSMKVRTCVGAVEITDFSAGLSGDADGVITLSISDTTDLEPYLLAVYDIQVTLPSGQKCYPYRGWVQNIVQRVT